MREIELKEMSLMYFKGIVRATVRFGSRETYVYGANATGKTTLFDAFTWLLFGKDSKDRSKFDLKTLDGGGRAITDVTHEVSALLEVDGKPLRLTRRLTEKWVKPRGQAEREFKGNEEERVWDDVPLSVSQWLERVNGLCPERTFRYVTNPLYFCAQSVTEQKAMLMEMAGGATRDEICRHDPDLEAVYDRLREGARLEDMRRQCLAEKRRIREEMDGIPARVDERRREIANIGSVDFGSIATSLEDDVRAHGEVCAQISDTSRVSEERGRECQTLVNSISVLRSEEAARVDELTGRTLSEWRRKDGEARRLREEKEACSERLRRAEAGADAERRTLERLGARRETLLAEYRSIKARSFEYTGGTVCPTCGRPLDDADIKVDYEAAYRKFSEAMEADVRRNVEEGSRLKADMARSEELVAGYERTVSEMRAETGRITADPLYGFSEAKPDVAVVLAGDGKLLSIREDIGKLQHALEEKRNASLPDTEALRRRRDELSASIEEKRATLARRDDIKRNEARVAELEEAYRTQAQALAQCERQEMTLLTFSKRQVLAVEERINSLFTMTTFKLTQTQINGGEVETCEAQHQGVPYSALNSAARINVGLDIIRALRRHVGVSAPIFIDNAESVNRLIDMEGQTIRLTVTDSPVMTVSTEEGEQAIDGCLARQLK